MCVCRSVCENVYGCECVRLRILPAAVAFLLDSQLRSHFKENFACCAEKYATFFACLSCGLCELCEYRCVSV